MNRNTKRNLALAAATFFIGLTATFFLVREYTQPLTQEALQAARERWRQAGIQQYQMRYRMNRDVYDMECDNGIVTSATVNGQPSRSADLRLYSVEGLFDTLQMDLENVADPSGPFAAGGQTVILRVRFHPELGYVERYLRSAGGMGRGASVELLEFVHLK